MNAEVLKAAMVRDEANKAKPYTDTVGKITIGIGHNLTDNGLSAKIRDLLYEDDMDECVHDCTASFPWFVGLDEVRQHVVLNMRFQLGPSRLRAFKQLIAALDRKDYGAAADAMTFSKWADQVPNRAKRLIAEMRTGQVEGQS